MRHVTDGELHAYLDGAMDLLPGDRGEEVREHISSCSVCGERLQDEEQLRLQAKTILGNPDLGEVPFPTFEELRERAEAPGSGPLLPKSDTDSNVRYRGPVKGLPLAWAATIVLALGVGWMGGQIGGTGLQPGDPDLRGSTQPPTAQAVSDTDAESSETIELSPSRQDPTAAPIPSGVEGVQERLLPAAGEIVAEERISDSEVEVLSPGMSRTSAAGSSAALAQLVSGEGDRVTDSISLALTGFSVDQQTGDSVVSPSAPEYSRTAAARSFESLAVIPDSLENSLALRGLKVASIEWEERVPGEKALLIRQVLSEGDTLELRYLGLLLGSHPDPRGLGAGGISQEEAPRGRVYANVLEASLPPGWHQVVMERDRGLLVARAPISEESLKALLKTLH